jgi:hypothetical protein
VRIRVDSQYLELVSERLVDFFQRASPQRGIRMPAALRRGDQAESGNENVPDRDLPGNLVGSAIPMDRYNSN